MGLHLTEEEMEEVLKHVPCDAEGKVNLQSVLKSVMATRQPSAFEKDRTDVQNLEGILASMGFSLTPEQLQEALKYAPVDVDGKVNLGEFMKAARAIQPHPRTGKMVAADDLSSTLAKMGLHLTEEEMEEVLKHVPHDAEGKVNLQSVLESVMATRQPSAFEKDRTDVQNLEGILASMGISLTPEQLQEALQYAPMDADGKVNLGEFMKAARAVQPHPSTGKMVAADDLSSTLAKMGLHLTEEEMEEVLKHVPRDAEGKVNLQSVLESVMATRQPSAFEKDRIDVQNLEGILASMGFSLTPEELQEAFKYAPVDGDGKVNLGEFMKGVRAVRPHFRPAAGMVSWGGLNGVKREVLKMPHIKKDGWIKGESRVHIDSLDAVLLEMGIHLTNKQLYEALKYAPMDADGKVDLEAFKRGVTAVLKADRRVDVSKLDSVLAEVGINFTQEEVQQILKLATVNEDGTVNLKDLLWAAQAIPSIQNKAVEISNLDSVLAALGICLTPEELQEALKRTKITNNRTVNLRDFIRACNATLTLPSTREHRAPRQHSSMGSYSLKFADMPRSRHRTPSVDVVNWNYKQESRQAWGRPSSTLSSVRKETSYSAPARYQSQMPDAKMLTLPKVTKNQALGRVHSSVFSTDKTRFGAVKILTNSELEAFRKAYDAFCKDHDGKIDLPALETTANNLGISLTEEEAFEELVFADTDGDGKVNFTDFLNIVTDSKRFIQAVAPKKDRLETVDAHGILFFELLSKLVETSVLPKKTTMAIVSYYRQKFLESTSKKAWNLDEKKHRQGRKRSPEKKMHSSSLAAFAGAGRIVVMKDKELEAFVRNLQETTLPSDSPYAQVPVFPLIPNQDCVMAGKPSKDIQKLEAQRRSEPVSSFEDHFFHKRRQLPVSKPSKTTRPTLTLPTELTSRGRSLTMNNIDEIRREVKKATDAYKKDVAVQERNKSLKLWRRLRGGEIGLERGNPSFYQTFSTYSWSWNICQELLTPRELQEYDNRLYHSLSQLATPVNKPIKANEKQRGNRK
ncbi:EF-hand calcium-binding domain-containing protein 3 [Sphaerodactylus townsendi]|uniref:EF-hand calcium-binding domain-containing protein 3 n=1 Tax=Sphaerodactylus townsendi TaxID=933632 RepID=UPI002026C1CE|nr:EF-hand calcium-binding domain-containing protein 3 [Sphaerodactylus townsendi]